MQTIEVCKRFGSMCLACSDREDVKQVLTTHSFIARCRWLLARDRAYIVRPYSVNSSDFYTGVSMASACELLNSPMVP